MADELQGQLKDIWSGNAAYKIVPDNQPIYSFDVANELNEAMETNEMASLIKFDLYVTVDKLMESIDESAESNKIFQLIQRIKASGYSLNEIVLFYQSNNIIRFDNWKEIESASQVEDRLKEKKQIPGSEVETVLLNNVQEKKTNYKFRIQAVLWGVGS